MKQILFSLVFLLGVFTVQAQDGPAPSPACMVKQTVGLTDITVEYSRPGKKDRVVYGELVPYGKVWRAGANAATKVTCSTNVNIGGAELEAGSYALLITPNKEEWTLHFYPYEGGRWATYRDSDVEPVNGKSCNGGNSTSGEVETFEISFDYLRDDSAKMHFTWENTDVVVPVTVPAAK